jgi:hypothetical protein
MAAMGELVAPAGKSEGDAVHLLTEYLLGDAGREHFYDLHPDASEGDYYEALYQLYELGNREESLSGLADAGCNQCKMLV